MCQACNSLFGVTDRKLESHLDTAASHVHGFLGKGTVLTGSLKGQTVLVIGRALELAPIRVNAISPGVIDTGAWDDFGEQGNADYFVGISARDPARRIGTPDDIAQGVLFALTNTFLTGQTLHIDGGEPLT